MCNVLIQGAVIDGTGVRDILNEWLTSAYCAFARSDISLDTMLRTELCEQGTLRCCARTDKLCVGEIRRGSIGMPRQTRQAVNHRDTVGIWRNRLLRLGARLSIRLHHLVLRLLYFCYSVLLSSRSYNKEHLMIRCPWWRLLL